MNADGAFHSFGFAARDHYSNLEPKDAKRWFYFEKFKMNLHYDEVNELIFSIFFYYHFVY
jgi:hypothetical protein